MLMLFIWYGWGLIEKKNKWTTEQLREFWRQDISLWQINEDGYDNDDENYRMW